MLFADEMVLVDEKRSGVNYRLKVWRQTSVSKSFRSSKIKTEYLKGKFSDITNEKKMDIKIDAQVIFKRENFKYIDSIIQRVQEIDDDVTHRNGRMDDIEAFGQGTMR